MSEVKKIPFTVIGGGIGGLAAALGAAESGREVYVLEQAEEFGEIGAGIQVAPNAMYILDKFGLLEEYSKNAVFPQRLVLKDAMTGKELADLDLGDAFKERYGYSYSVVHRTDIHKVFLDACRAHENITLLTDHRVVKVENRGDSVYIECEGGLKYEADALIGADGLKSVTRQNFSDDQPICSEYVAYRGAIPVEEMEDLVNYDDVIMWIGPYLHLVQYPIRRKELYNQVAVFKSFKYSRDIEHTTDWGTPEELEEHFGKCVPQVRHAVKFMETGRRWPLFDRIPIENWVDGKVTLLGDAAHPMLQYLAQGACQALEDAYFLSQKLKEYPGNDNLNKAFKEYQEERQPRTARVQTTARKWGEVLHTADPIAQLMRDMYLKKHDSQDYSEVEWLYGYYRDKN